MGVKMQRPFSPRWAMNRRLPVQEKKKKKREEKKQEKKKIKKAQTTAQIMHICNPPGMQFESGMA